MTLNTIMTLSKITHAIGKITLPQIYLKGAVAAGNGFCGFAECFGGLLFTFCSLVLTRYLLIFYNVMK